MPLCPRLKQDVHRRESHQLQAEALREKVARLTEEVAAAQRAPVCSCANCQRHREASLQGSGDSTTEYRSARTSVPAGAWEAIESPGNKRAGDGAGRQGGQQGQRRETDSDVTAQQFSSAETARRTAASHTHDSAGADVAAAHAPFPYV